MWYDEVAIVLIIDTVFRTRPFNLLLISCFNIWLFAWTQISVKILLLPNENVDGSKKYFSKLIYGGYTFADVITFK